MNKTKDFNMVLPFPFNKNWSAERGFPTQIPGHCPNTTDLTVFLVTSYSLETIFGILGNICLISVIVRQKEKANVTSVLITNLIVSDLFMSIVCLPFTIVYTLMDYWIFGEVLCKMTSFIQCTSVSVSILSLVLIALERHQLIINPTGWRPSIPQAYLGIVVIWTVASLISLPFLTTSVLTYDLYKHFSYITEASADKPICMDVWPSDQHRLIYTTALLLLQYCIPLFFILACYLRIYLRLQKRKDMCEKRDYSGREVQLRRINVLSMVVAFAVCWLPLHVFNSIEDWDYKAISPCYHSLIFSLCHLVAMASACVNPVIYGFLNSNFKKEVKSLMLSCQHNSSLEEYEHLPLSTMQTEVSKGSVRLSCRHNSI
uniref:Neuropeptide Y receptor type 4-like n=1 Tax=Pelodiscus sinensis TaxID=13735 RepID=K7EXT7_PELSI|nr:neuropeptide Y receptor type 4-like [Pelodiscus sinensis]|eukprot:XP_006118212.1 neuropeptide Y receptor type 4-like [Pelodiscus sinensis]